MVSLISYNNSISVFCVTLASFILISCVFVLTLGCIDELLTFDTCEVKGYTYEKWQVVYIWTDGETLKLVEIWGDDAIRAMLEGSRRNRDVFKKLGREMEAAGYSKTAEQYQGKIKKLKYEYKKIKDKHGQTGEGRKDWKFLEPMDGYFPPGPRKLLASRAQKPGLIPRLLVFLAHCAHARLPFTRPKEGPRFFTLEWVKGQAWNYSLRTPRMSFDPP